MSDDRKNTPGRLERLAHVVRQIGPLEVELEIRGTPKSETNQFEQLVRRAKSMYRARRQRERAFEDAAALFGEPAWDILLDLFIAEIEQRNVSVSSAAIASNAPPTTGLRWIAALVSAGLVARHHGASDRRLSYLRLTDKGFDSMVRYLRSVD